MDRMDAIQKLEELSSLMDEYRIADMFLGGTGISTAGAKSQEVCARAHGIPSIPDALDCLPNVPKLDQNQYLQANQAMKKYRKTIRLCLLVSAVGLVGGILLKKAFLTGLIGPGLAIALVFWFFKHLAEKQYKRDKKAYDVKVAKYNNELTVFRSALDAYTQQRAVGIAALKEKMARFPEYQAEWNEIEREYMENKKRFMQSRDELAQQIDAYDFLPQQYRHLVQNIIDLLKSGRADDYKEALNMAIYEEREEQERAARRAEEARRIALEEQRAAAERRHQMQMEAQQRAHNEKMEKQAAQAEHDRRVAEKQAAQKAQKAAWDQQAALKQAAFRRCNSCANVGRCNIKFRDAAINCAAFRPR